MVLAVEQYHLEMNLAEWYRSDWFPIFYDEGGTAEVVTRGGNGAVLILDRSGPDGAVEEAPSLGELFAQIVARYRAGAYTGATRCRVLWRRLGELAGRPDPGGARSVSRLPGHR